MPSSPRTLSKSDFKTARSCDAKLFFRENGYPDTNSSDPYLQMLAVGGYMVEALACAMRPEGILLEYGRDMVSDYQRTLELLQREEVTLFQATLLHGRRMARVDIIEKRGNVVRLIEVKAKSLDGDKHRANIMEGGRGLLRSSKRPHAILSDWIEKLGDVTFQAIMLEQALPGHTILPFLLLVDKSKRSAIDDVPRLFEIDRREGADGTKRIHTATFIGSHEQLTSLDLLMEVDVSAEVSLLRESVEAEATRFEGMLDAPFDQAWAQRGAKCSDCEYRVDAAVERNGFAHCWGTLASVTPHALELHSISSVKATDRSPLIEWLVRAGTVSLFDIPESLLVKADGEVGPQARRQIRQIEHARTGETWVGPSLAEKIQAIRYPIHFIDFETSRIALPYHANMRPYGQVAFQWSCHTVDYPGAAPRHTEWLNDQETWPNLTFARTLREVIGDSDSIMTWTSFEATQLKEIAAEHQRFAVHDQGLVDWVATLVQTRLIDLHKWAREDFYHPGMHGRTSIKVVLDALWKDDVSMRDQFVAWTGMPVSETIDPYSALPALVIAGVTQDVREGTGAIRAYEAMMYGVERHDEMSRQAWRELLLRYCKLDTLSMVLIFEYWRRLTRHGLM